MTRALMSEPALTVIMVTIKASIIRKFPGHKGKSLTRSVGSLTLLFQRDSQPGLEILTPGQSWSSAPVFPPGTEGDKFPPILVNIGDLLNYWTDGLLKSTVHRVVFPQDGGSDRYSIAYFCHPANDTRLVQIPSEMINNKNSKKHRSHSSRNTNEIMTAQEHLNVRLAATYGWEKQDVPSAS